MIRIVWKQGVVRKDGGGGSQREGAFWKLQKPLPVKYGNKYGHGGVSVNINRVQ